MSTNEPLGEGPLDEVILAKLANELFAAWPEEGRWGPGIPPPPGRALTLDADPMTTVEPGGAASAPSFESVGTPPVTTPASDADARAAGVAIPADIVAEKLDPELPYVPTVPGYYFLDEAIAAAQGTPAALSAEILDLESLIGVDQSGIVPPLPLEAVIPDLGLDVEPYDPESVRRDFPILEEEIHGRRLVWLDNAATTQKPRAVIDRIAEFYRHEYSNVHRASHTLAARSTDAYEGAREKVRRFLNASTPREIVFVRGTTEAINLVAQSWGRKNLEAGDEIVITWLEHHSNIVPWQQLATERGARLRVAPIDDRGQILLNEYEKLLGPRTRIVSLTQLSNALGTVVPVREMTEMAHRYGAKVLVDGAQAVSHMRVDVQALGCDFFAFSGHKIFAPTGIGVLYGKRDLLDAMPPWQGGGNMIADVTFEATVFLPAPARFEAGTGSIADAVGLGAALDYLGRIGLENVARHERALLVHATQELERIPGLRIIGTAREKAAVISFVMAGRRSEDVGTALDREGIAVRAGHHCAQPALRRFGLESTVRPSFALYNTRDDIDALVTTLWRIQAGLTG
jgi:cysteine desulfurase/selenocysteine lyase